MIHPLTAYAPEKQGMFAGLPMETYQLAPGLSKSAADTLRRSPLDYYKQYVTREVKREATPAMERGTITHSIVWEGRTDYHVRPATYPAAESAKKDAPLVDKPWNANATFCKDWLAAHKDKPVLSPDAAYEVELGARYIREHPHAAQLLAKVGMVEVSMFARESTYGHVIKCRADKVWFEDGRAFFADLKTTADASTRAISRTILDRRYHAQAGMHRIITELLGFEFGGFYLIFAELGEVPKCNVRKLADQAVQKGMDEIRADIDLWHKCRIAQNWPEWHDSEEHIGHIDLPEFVYFDDDEITISAAA